MVANAYGKIYRRRDLLIYLSARFLAEAAALAQSVAIGWTVYKLSGTPLSLGLVGVVQFIPMVLLTLPAGELCDRLSPRRLAITGLALQSLCAVAFLVLSLGQSSALWPLYGVLLIVGVARALAEPAEQALLPFLVPAERLPRAIAAASSAWQTAVIAGPALGGADLVHPTV